MAALAGRPNLQLIGLGGLFHNETQAFAGPVTLTELQPMRVQLVFLGASSIPRRGAVLRQPAGRRAQEGR